MAQAPDPSSDADGTGALVIHVGHEELIIRQRYEQLSIANDLLIGT